MSKVTLSVFAKWGKKINILGVYDGPLHINTRITNNSNSNIHISKICISIKTSYLIFFTNSEDILISNFDIDIKPKNNISISLDIRQISDNYSIDKMFTVKVYYENTFTESNIFTVRQFHENVLS